LSTRVIQEVGHVQLMPRRMPGGLRHNDSCSNGSFLSDPLQIKSQLADWGWKEYPVIGLVLSFDSNLVGFRC